MNAKQAKSIIVEGTIVEQVPKLFKPGVYLTSADIAAELEVNQASISNILKAMEKQGTIEHRRTTTNSFLYALTGEFDKL